MKRFPDKKPVNYSHKTVLPYQIVYNKEYLEKKYYETPFIMNKSFFKSKFMDERSIPNSALYIENSKKFNKNIPFSMIDISSKNNKLIEPKNNLIKMTISDIKPNESPNDLRRLLNKNGLNPVEINFNTNPITSKNTGKGFIIMPTRCNSDSLDLKLRFRNLGLETSLTK